MHDKRAFDLEDTPPHLQPIKESVLRIIHPIKEVTDETKAHSSLLFSAKRTNASKKLPAYYLLYFLFVDLLKFKNLGQFEKISWSIPIDYKGTVYLLEHRKMGLGLFAHDPATEEQAAIEIVIRIQKAVRIATPFFEWIANRAVAASMVNVNNNSWILHERFNYLRTTSEEKLKESSERRNEQLSIDGTNLDARKWLNLTFPALRLTTEAKMLATSAVEAFYSWTEHVFIHIAILTERITSAHEIAKLVNADWAEKYKAALDISKPTEKNFFDNLVEIRRNLRNHVAHGAFGK